MSEIEYAVAQASRAEKVIEPIHSICRDAKRVFAQYAPLISKATAWAINVKNLREHPYPVMQLIEPDFPQIDCDPEAEPVAPRRIGFNR